MAFLIPILVLLTLLWFGMIWNCFHPPQFRPMGWKFWQVYWTGTLGMVVLIGWFKPIRDFIFGP